MRQLIWDVITHICLGPGQTFRAMQLNVYFSILSLSLFLIFHCLFQRIREALWWKVKIYFEFQFKKMKICIYIISTYITDILCMKIEVIWILNMNAYYTYEIDSQTKTALFVCNYFQNSISNLYHFDFIVFQFAADAALSWLLLLLLLYWKSIACFWYLQHD